MNSFFQTVPLQFLNALLSYLGDSVSYGTTSSGLTSPLACCPSPSFSRVVTPSEGIVRWKLRLEYFAYETLQDFRIAKLFEIIVDYPERYFLSLTVLISPRISHLRPNQIYCHKLKISYISDGNFVDATVLLLLKT